MAMVIQKDQLQHTAGSFFFFSPSGRLQELVTEYYFPRH
jgi:hypothetical protein